MTVYEPESGSANQGTTFECLNLASVWRLPVIFVFENNGYAASTAASFSVASGGIAKRPAGKAAVQAALDDRHGAWRWRLAQATHNCHLASGLGEQLGQARRLI